MSFYILCYFGIYLILRSSLSLAPWLTPVILATQEAEIRRIKVQSQPRLNSSRNPILNKHITHKKRRLVEWLKV
jgi:hypothetical protein